MLTQLGETHPVQPVVAPQLCFAPGTPPDVIKRYYDSTPPLLDVYRLGTRWTSTANQAGPLG